MNYYNQNTGYTCGPACARMMLSNFGIEATEHELVALLGTTPMGGTHYDAFNKLLSKYGLAAVKGEGAPDMKTLDQLQALIKTGWIVIIGYTIDVPHYSILLEHNGNHLFLADPFRGKRVAEPIKKFVFRWKIVPDDFPMFNLDPTLKSKGWWIAFNKQHQDEND